MWRTLLLPEALEKEFSDSDFVRVSEWVRKNVYLTEKQSPGQAGFYNPDLTPYAIGLMDSFHDGDYDEEHIIKSAQVGITEGVPLNIIRYSVAEEPMNTIYAVDSAEEVKKIGHVRLVPTLRNCAATAAQIPDDADEITSLSINLRDVIIYLLGSFAKGGFENKAAALIFLDELAKHNVKKGEPDSVALARERFKTLHGKRRKLYSLTKPGVRGKVGIEYREYMSGTRHKFRIPCPHCGERQELVWERMRFEHLRGPDGNYDLDRVLRETFYECVQGCRIEHSSLAWMCLTASRLPDRGWQPTNTDTGKYAPQPRKRSWHISDLYSPWATWGQLALEWIASEDDAQLRAAFRIGRLGLWPEMEAAEINKHKLLRLTKPLSHRSYTRRTLPFVPELISCHVDVQKRFQKWVIGGFNARGDWFVTDYGFTTDMDDLLRVCADPIKCSAGPDEKIVDIVPELLVMDEGHDELAARSFVVRANTFFYYGAYTVKGARSRDSKNAVWRTDVIIEGGGKHPAYYFRDNAVKRAFYVRRVLKVLELLQKVEREQDPIKRGLIAGRLQRLRHFWLPENVTDAFLEELSQERLAVVNEAEVWLDPEGANDWGDGCKYCEVVWTYMADKLSDGSEPPSDDDAEESVRTDGSEAASALAALMAPPKPL